MKTVLGMVSLKHEEMKRCPATVIMYTTIQFSEMEVVSSDSDYVHDDTFSETEAEEIPKEILNTIDPLNVESDKEFLGFE
jgi:hypothetical protein